MQNRIGYKTQDFPFHAIPQPVKTMSAQEFAALGADSAVFAREITGDQLSQFIPEAEGAPEDGIFQMIMSADGSPVLVTDNDAAVYEWLEHNDIVLVQRH